MTTQTPPGYRKLGLKVGDHVIVHIRPGSFPTDSDRRAGSYTLSGVVYELPRQPGLLWVAQHIVSDKDGDTPPTMNVLVTEPAVEVTE